ncbi:GUN4 domain-containing protein [Nostoc sp.]|uniref:GUN4 domain-containing protein n=1 Tax=Nostoc sp. TaxID=1180 RepID=UPI002FF4E01A
MGLLVFIIVVVTVLGVVYLSKQDFTTTQEPVKKVPEIDESQLNDDLSSSSDIDYRKLRLLLASSLFEEADLETKCIFGCLINPKYGSKWNAYEDNTYGLSRIPRIDLLTINELWAKYSKGRFSFSVQGNIFDKIYIDLINEMTIKNEEEKFGMTKETIQATAYFDA